MMAAERQAKRVPVGGQAVADGIMPGRRTKPGGGEGLYGCEYGLLAAIQVSHMSQCNTLQYNQVHIAERHTSLPPEWRVTACSI